MINQGSVHTIAGSFDQKRLTALQDTIKGHQKGEVIKFEGQDLDVGFGGYLAEYVSGELSKRNDGL